MRRQSVTNASKSASSVAVACATAVPSMPTWCARIVLVEIDLRVDNLLSLFQHNSMNPQDEVASHVAQLYEEHIVSLVERYEREILSRINVVVRRGRNKVHFGSRCGTAWRPWFDDVFCCCLCCLPRIPTDVLTTLQQRFKAMGFRVRLAYHERYITISW